MKVLVKYYGYFNVTCWLLLCLAEILSFFVGETFPRDLGQDRGYYYQNMWLCWITYLVLEMEEKNYKQSEGLDGTK